MELDIKTLVKKLNLDLENPIRKHWIRNTKYQIRKQWILEISLKEFIKILITEYIKIKISVNRTFIISVIEYSNNLLLSKFTDLRARNPT